MSLSPRPIILLLVVLQLATYGSCVFLNKQISGLGHEARPGTGVYFNESLAGTSFLSDSTTDPSILFARQSVCSNGVVTCGTGTCQNCDTCCGGSQCNAFSFGTCCTNGQTCAEGLSCWYQISGTRTGCCPPGLTGCFTTPFSCCNPGATCGSTGCIGSASIFVDIVEVTYTSTVSRFTTNLLVVTSPSGAAATVSVTVFATSVNTTVFTVTSTASVAAAKARRGILEAVRGQLEKYDIVPRAIPTTTFVVSEYSFATILSTVVSTSIFLSGSVAVHTVTYTSTVVNQVSFTSTVVVTTTIAGPIKTTLTSTAVVTPVNTPMNTPGNTPANTPVNTPVNTPANTPAFTPLTTTTSSNGVVVVIPVTTSSVSPTPTPSGPGGGLSTGAKAGIGAGVGISAAASLVFLTLFLLGRRRSKSEQGPDPGDSGQTVEVTKTDPKPELPSPGPYMGPMPEKPHRETYQYMPATAESVSPQHQNMSPTSPTPSSTTRFSELGGVSSTQGRAEVSAQPMSYQAAIGSDYEHYELAANEAGRPRSEMR